MNMFNSDEICMDVVNGKLGIRQALDKVANECLTVLRETSNVQIVIAPRGWIFVGYTSNDGNDLVITNASVIRIWGTAAGIGELIKGPTNKTKLDPTGTVRVPLSAVLACIDCEVSPWVSVLK
jgi:hypothetical protein